MKKSLTLAFAIAGLLVQNGMTYAQSANSTPPPGLPLTIVPPVQTDYMGPSQQEKLRNSILELATNNGVVTLDGLGALVLAPTLRLVDEQTVSPGVQSLYVVTAELLLTVQQADNGAIFSTTSRKLRGSGRNRSLALDNALRQIDANDPVLVDFIAKSTQKARIYYQQQCPALLQKAEQFKQTNQFARAFGLLLSIPAQTPCFDEAAKRLGAAFALYQQQSCGRLLTEGRASIAARKFDEGLTILSQVDPLSPCAAEARQLIDKAAVETAADNKQKWEVLRQAFADLRTVEQYRQQLIRDFLNRHYLTHSLYDLHSLNR